MATNGFGQTDATISFGFIGVREKPVAADMDRDGIDDIGLWVSDRAGVSPGENGEWYFLMSNAFGQDRAVRYGTMHFLDHAFTPIPFGKDVYASFGDEFAVPVIGNFDPPVTPADGNVPSTGLTNLDNRCDVNGDGSVNALDALLQINDANANGLRPVAVGQSGPPFLDVNQDGWISPADVLATVNYLNSQAAAGSGEGEGEGSLTGDLAPVSVASPAATPAGAAAEARTYVELAGLLVESAPPAGAVPSAAAKVDQYFAKGDHAADDLAVYSSDLADAVLTGTSRSVQRATGDDAANLALDGVLTDLAGDQDRSQENSADRFFAKLGRFVRPRA